ncbi:MAG: GerMN domain-containing protein [Rivularia sp. (in: Bacteria)]|nr:GerMN domain-containing protein [Rivularia sp. MS3]
MNKLSIFCSLLWVTAGISNGNAAQVSANSTTSATYKVAQAVDVPQPRNVNYERYYNDRFNFSIFYPGELLNKQDAPQNNDGRTFVSPDRNIVMKVFGRYNIQDENIESLYNQQFNQTNKEVTYKSLGDDYFVVSGYENNQVFYNKVLFSNNRILHLNIDYNKSLQPEFDSIVREISNSFRGYERVQDGRYIEFGESPFNGLPKYVDLQSIQQTDTNTYNYKIMTGLNPSTSVSTARVNCNQLSTIRFLENDKVVETYPTQAGPYSYYDANQAVCQQKNAANPEPNPNPDKQYQVKVFFPTSASNDDFTAVQPVTRTTDNLGVARFALNQLIAGPTNSEQQNGLTDVLDLAGESTCEQDFRITINRGVALLRFCRDVPTGGVGDDARIKTAINKTLKQFPTVNKVVILNNNGDCFKDASGKNLCFK